MAQPPYPPPGPAPPYGPYGPYGPVPPYPVPQPRKQDTIVLTILVLVIVAIALFALVVFAILSFITNFLPPGQDLVVGFSNPQIVNGNATFTVAIVTERWSPSRFNVSAQVDGVTGSSRPMNTTSGGETLLAVGSVTLQVVWTDIDGDGTVSQGDRFDVEGAGAPLPAGRTFVLYLLWAASNEVVGSQAWTT